MRVVNKPWGREEIWIETDSYVGKDLFINEGSRLSLQYHEKKEETLRLMFGQVKVTYGKDKDNLETFIMEVDDIFHVPPGTIHRFEAMENSCLLEISTTFLDDVVRLEDDYNR
jgi:mannose-6-phosphate isomerase-like protein (cupin superfamily)